MTTGSWEPLPALTTNVVTAVNRVKGRIATNNVKKLMSETTKFSIKIDDGYCEYTYEPSISDDLSISDVAAIIYKGLGLDPDSRVGKLTRKFNEKRNEQEN